MAETEKETAAAAPRRAAAAPASTDAQLVEPRPSAADRIEASREFRADELKEAAKPAKIGAADTGDIEASGAIMEPDVKSAIDVDHAAVDNNPRAGTTALQNRIDFNDPNLTNNEAVEQRLSDQS